jgi:hypothetical protein
MGSMAAKRSIVNKKVSASKKKVSRKKKTVAKVAAPLSAAAQAIAERLTRVEVSASVASGRIDELQAKVKTARDKFSKNGDGRSKRTVESSVEKLAALRAKAAEATAKVRDAAAELEAQTKLDAAVTKRDAALSAAVDKFRAKWLKDFARSEAAKARAARARAKAKAKAKK